MKVDMKKRILIVVSLFYPQKKGGGPAISIMNLVLAIKDVFDIYVLTKNHELHSKEPLSGVHQGWNEYSFAKVYYCNDDEHTISGFQNIISQVKPDIIYQNSFFSYDDVLPVLLYKKKNPNIRVIIAPRGELCSNPRKVGRLKKKMYLDILKLTGLMRNVEFHTTGDAETLEVQEVFEKEKYKYHNIQNISVLQVDGINLPDKKPNSLKLVYIARIQKKKNLHYAIECLKNQNGQIIYDIYGPAEEPEYWQKCQEIISTLPENVSVNYRGMVERENIITTLQNYHAFFMPTLSENYGHSIVEALMAYRPVIISDQTPWVDLEKHKVGFSIPLNCQDSFVEAIHKMAELDMDELMDMCQKSREYIRAQLNYEQLRRNYVGMFGG